MRPGQEQASVTTSILDEAMRAMKIPTLEFLDRNRLLESLILNTEKLAKLNVHVAPLSKVDVTSNISSER